MERHRRGLPKTKDSGQYEFDTSMSLPTNHLHGLLLTPGVDKGTLPFITRLMILAMILALSFKI
jgi:hypothetical protein